MKIALVYDAVYPWIKGGGEKHNYELALELRHRGHEVHLFGMNCWQGPHDMEREGLHYHALAPYRPLYARSGRRSPWPPVWFALGVLRRLPRYRLHEFDVIDVNAYPFFSVLAFWLIRCLFARRVPWLLTWLEVWGPKYWRDYLGRLGWLGAKIERLCARLGPTHRCISPTTARRLHELLGVDRERIHMIPCGFSLPEGIAGAPREPHKVVVAGRLLHNKRVDLVLRAWPAVMARLPQARLHIVGDGPERAPCEHLASQLELGKTVRFLGQLPRWEDVLRETASACLVAQPSDREGQSLVVAEAMAVGTPVLVAAGPETAAADYLDDYPDRDRVTVPVSAGPEAWSEKIIDLLTDAELRARLVEQGRRRIQSLDWQESIAPRMEAFYRSTRGVE